MTLLKKKATVKVYTTKQHKAGFNKEIYRLVLFISFKTRQQI